MTKHNAANERIKRQYLTRLKEAGRCSEATVDAVANAIARFEMDTGHKDFKGFHIEQAVAFKRHLSERVAKSTGQPLSKATAYAILSHLKRFFFWLADQPGFRSRIRYSDADYFNVSEKDARIATARRERSYPTLEQIQHTVGQMPAQNDVELRNRALIAFTLLTGARDSALASLKLKHVDLARHLLDQDARDVNTKNSKTFQTVFFQVGEDIENIVEEWIHYLRERKLWGNDDPLFPATEVKVAGNTRQFEVTGLKREHWRTATPIRVIFKTAFTAVGLPYFNPHSFRKTLVALAHDRCKTPEELKAWSQNLGHEDVLTTLQSYGAVRTSRQAEIIRELGKPITSGTPIAADAIADAIIQRLRVATVQVELDQGANRCPKTTLDQALRD